jgi:hypothetical protein
MRVIFLDIDGVLNSHRSAVAMQTFHTLDPIAVKMLFRIVTLAEAKIVISSTWRQDKQWLTTIWGALRQAGWPWVHTGFLPLGECPIIDRTDVLPGVRGIEIQAWLDANPEYDDYIILDDDSDMLDSQMDRFIKCHYHTGLGWEGWQQIRKIWPEVDNTTEFRELETYE